MATCADLVAAVVALNETIQDVRDNYLTVHDSVDDVDVSLAGLLLRIERDLRVKIPATVDDPEKVYTVVKSLTNLATILEERLSSRAYKIEADTRYIEVLQYVADSITERIAQHTQVSSGSSELADTGLADTVALDTATDNNTPGLLG